MGTPPQTTAESTYIRFLKINPLGDVRIKSSIRGEVSGDVSTSDKVRVISRLSWGKVQKTPHVPLGTGSFLLTGRRGFETLYTFINGDNPATCGIE
jgi:hypothetical protein